MFFQVLDSAKAAYEVSNLQYAALNLTMTNIRTAMGSMDLDELLSKRDEINARLLTVVDEATTPWGRQGDPHRDQGHQPTDGPGRGSMGRQMKAERQARAIPRGRKASASPRSCGQMVRNRRRSCRPRARREPRSETPRHANAWPRPRPRRRRWCRRPSPRGDVQAVNYFVAQKYVEALQTIGSAPNQKLIFMPMEASGLIGAIGGVAELAKAAMEKGKA